MNAVLLAIDIGTTGVRVALFDVRGGLIADATAPASPDVSEAGWAEAVPERWWQLTCRLLGELAARAPRGAVAAVAAVAVAGQAPTAVLVDDAGNALGNAILWLDTRADAEARALGSDAYYLGPKLAWLAAHEPERLARARWVLQSHAFLAHKLTGEVATDPSTAALCAPLFDLAARTWREEACAAVGVRRDQLPPIRTAHEVLGEVTAVAARATGLRAGTPVVVGGGDFAAATLGAGVLEEGEACLMLGTAGNLLVPRRTPGTDARLINAHHVGTERWLSLGGTLAGGAQEWLRHALARGAGGDDTAVRGPLPAFDLLDGEAARVPAGSAGLAFLPYLQGERTPIWDASARGAFVGLSLQHGRGHLWRALLEGVALSFVDCQAVLEEGGVHLREVVAANGGGKSALFRQILCDALGVPLVYMPGASGTVAGAAILAGLGVGAFEDASAARTWRGETLRHEPDPEATATYRARLAVRREIYAGLRGAFAKLKAG
jgi:xylulokinase